MDFVTIVPLILIGAVIFFWLSRRRRSNDAEQLQLQQQAQRWFDARARIAGNPEADLAELRGLLAMENPHDDLFFARLAVLRILSQNPSLPVELQAAAINRVSQEESAARIDKSLRSLAKSSGGVQGFVGFATDI